MNFRHFQYFIREATQYLLRNRLLSIATISTVAICILILGTVVLISINLNQFMDYLENDIEILVYLERDLSPDELSKIKNSLDEIDKIETAEFVSRDKGLEELQSKLGEKGYDLEKTLGDNPLPHRYEISVKNPEYISQVAEDLATIEGVDKVTYGQEVVDRLLTATHWIKIISLSFIILLFIGALILIVTTIRLAIYSRRKEIYLMKLIGANDWFIRWPFFIEGIILGFGGAFVAISILAAGYGSFVANYPSILFMSLVSSHSILLELYAYLLGAGTVIGITGTIISLNRFLKV